MAKRTRGERSRATAKPTPAHAPRRARARPEREARPQEPFFSLHVLIYPEEDAWLAHCLEFDTVGQGASPEEARKDLMDGLESLILYAIECDEVPGLYSPAPPELWQRFASAPSQGVRVNVEAGRRLPPTCIEERLAAA